MTVSALRQQRHTTPADATADATGDPLLVALAQARQRLNQADIEMRVLIALGREFTAPRPYTCRQLAQAAAMSISGVHTAYGPREMAYLQLILSCEQTVPAFLRGPVTALRHRPSPHLDDGHQ